MLTKAARMSATRERGIILVMVVGVLAMLFIVGASLLIVGRFERQTAEVQAAGRDIEAVGVAITDPIVVGLREDAVGADGVPYNHGWPANGGDDSAIEDYADFPALVPVQDGDTPAEKARKQARSGDLLLSSVEPYLDGSEWRLYAASWGLDADPSRAGRVWVSDVGLTGGPRRDADGDGIRDSADSSALADLSAMFGGGYEMELRVVPHGGMVLLDWLTHPALLAQVIHAKDINPAATDYSGIGEPELRGKLFGLTLDPAVEEGRLRRRFMLPPLLPVPAGGDYRTVAPELVTLLPVTTGYADATGETEGHPAEWWNADRAGPINHWWPFDKDVLPEDDQRWRELLTPGIALTETDEAGEPIYDAADDKYDRRRLITTINSDDVVRRWRDEERLNRFVDPGPDGTSGTTDDTPLFRDVMNPPESGADTNAYGRDASGSTVFNGPGVRTAFSLRDVLGVKQVVNPTPPPPFLYEHDPAASYTRAVQLTAYFLAMIQHTSVPGSGEDHPSDAQLTEQLRTAAQLAVNMLDFADGDQTPSYFAWNGQDGSGHPISVEVIGVEKQPFITEAYAKKFYEAQDLGDGPEWKSDLSADSIYAIELYNPYGDPLDVSDYVLRVVDSAGDEKVPPVELDLSVLADPRIGPYNYLVLANHDTDATSGAPFPIADPPAGTFAAVFPLTFKIEAEDGVQLVRKSRWELGPGGSSLNDSANVVVDWLRPGPVRLGAPNSSWAQPPAKAIREPEDTADLLVRDSSLQRHKEVAGAAPVFWHVTLSRQMLFPLPWEEEDEAVNPSPLPTNATRPYMHSLLGTDSYGNQRVVAKEFAGIEFSVPDPLPDLDPLPASVMMFAAKDAIAPFPVVTSDRGVDSGTGGTVAFPTTGTLLLVTRYAHLPAQGTMTEDKPVTVAATEVPDGVAGREPISSDPNNPGQMQQVDNGHLPIFDDKQRCTDRTEDPPQGRLDVPWGQLVFDYFTALPLEELVRNPIADDATYHGTFGDYPRLEWVNNTLGPKVRGRININFAPWWVLDGLPVLPDAWVLGGPGGLAELPVPELEAQRLDPAGTLSQSMAGARFVHLLMDEVYVGSPPLPYGPDPEDLPGPATPPVGLPSVSPDLARYMVSYREQRPVDGRNAANDNNADGDAPGFVTAGALCDLVTKVRVTVETLKNDTGSGPEPDTKTATLGSLQNYSYGEIVDDGPDDQPGTGDDVVVRHKPFSYLGYLQLVAPVVRLQDWATVKNHVFTVYANISKSEIHLRTQVTVDRTRCLYSPNDLPVRITETEPISYYNAVDD